MSVETLLKTVPKFDGKSGAIEWLYKFEAIIDLLGIPAEKILSHIILFLDGEAYLWYSSVLNFSMFSSLDVFRDLFLKWFAPPTEKVMDNLSKCTFTEGGRFRDYVMSQSKLFSSLNQRLDNVAKIQWFIRGLPQNRRQDFLSKNFRRYEDLVYYAISFDKLSLPESKTNSILPSVEVHESSFDRESTSDIPIRRSRVSKIKKSKTSDSAKQASVSSLESPNSTSCTVRAFTNTKIKSSSIISKACQDLGLSHEVFSLINPDTFASESTPYPLIFQVQVNGIQTNAGIHNLFKQSTISPTLLKKVKSGDTKLKEINRSGVDRGKSYIAEIRFSSGIEFECIVQVRELQKVGLILGEDFLFKNRAKMHYGPNSLEIHSDT
ncbi:hypothetical protein DSO57_1032891 [Entomophthora muscae]|uniref:Uncharacterized protein n=1 Tax=Entomophthora muscae TaxID=34485 RepID=A0ACC2REZ7_9FUNG|nr:hypothetical protein DSO57_1032891 [Entomophthora muscae]